MNTEKNVIGAMSKSEFAQLYFPTLDGKTAMKHIRQWIMVHPNVQTRLADTGYRKTQKLLMPLQVQILMDAFGEP